MVKAFLSALLAVMVWTGAAPAQDYIIQPGDRLGISVLEDPSLNRQVLVRPDGRISLPLAGTVQAAERTPEQLQTAIRNALARDFVEAPTVTVSLESLGEGIAEEEEVEVSSVYVLGQVGQPGQYTFLTETPINVLQALALAGGPGVFAATERIQIRRLGDQPTVFFFNYALIEDGEAPVDAIEIRDGDVIVVPQRGLFE